VRQLRGFCAISSGTVPAVIRASSTGAQTGERFVPDDPADESKARIRAAIIGHLQRYPLAGDTTEGMIACWMPLGHGEAVRFVEEVVASMAASGELVAQQLPDGRILYKRGPRL
jgi:hypothetical protein